MSSTSPHESFDRDLVAPDRPELPELELVDDAEVVSGGALKDITSDRYQAPDVAAGINEKKPGPNDEILPGSELHLIEDNAHPGVPENAAGVDEETARLFNNASGSVESGDPFAGTRRMTADAPALTGEQMGNKDLITDAGEMAKAENFAGKIGGEMAEFMDVARKDKELQGLITEQNLPLVEKFYRSEFPKFISDYGKLLKEQGITNQKKMEEIFLKMPNAEKELYGTALKKQVQGADALRARQTRTGERQARDMAAAKKAVDDLKAGKSPNEVLKTDLAA